MSLKEKTFELHKRAESRPFNQLLINDGLNKTQTLEYLRVHYSIFSTIENKVQLNKEMVRANLIKQDIDELSNEKIYDSPITKTYEAYLNNLNVEEINPHIYLNYLAIMFGGQMIKKNIVGSGRMYDFNNFKDTIQEIRLIEKDNELWVNQVNTGYIFWIHIFDLLHEQYC